MARLLKRFATAALALALFAPVAGSAWAAAPAPRKPLEVSRFLGRWFEVARTPNLHERGCVSASMEFSRVAGERYEVTQTCRKARAGAVQRVRAGARFEDAAGHAKLELSFFGGLIHAHYWVLDRDRDYRWAVVSTSGGRYVWLLSRQPTLPPSERLESEAALRSLGFDPAKLQFAGA